MPFSFLPLGVILAAAVLIGALAVFGLILRAMDRAIVGVHYTAVSGLVAGLRTWSAPAAPAAAPTPVGPQATTDPPADVIDLVSRRIGPSNGSGG